MLGWERVKNMGYIFNLLGWGSVKNIHKHMQEIYTYKSCIYTHHPKPFALSFINTSFKQYTCAQDGRVFSLVLITVFYM